MTTAPATTLAVPVAGVVVVKLVTAALITSPVGV
jgi:hypothetical protein